MGVPVVHALGTWQAEVILFACDVRKRKRKWNMVWATRAYRRDVSKVGLAAWVVALEWMKLDVQSATFSYRPTLARDQGTLVGVSFFFGTWAVLFMGRPPLTLGWSQ